jgi:hypothetical protein
MVASIVWILSRGHIHSRRSRSARVAASQFTVLDRKFIDNTTIDAANALFDEHGMDLPTKDECDSKLVGLALLEYAGTMTHALGQKLVMSNYFGAETEFLHSWKVLDCIQLAEPMHAIHLGFGVEAPKNLVFAMSRECIEQIFSTPVLGAITLVGDVVKSMLARGGDAVDQSTHPNTIMGIPYPLCVFIVTGWWEHVVLDRRFRCSHDAHFHSQWASLHSAEDADSVAIQVVSGNDNATCFSADMFVSLAGQLDSWAPRIVAPGAVDQCHLDNYVLWLMDCAHNTTSDSFKNHAWNKSKGQGGRWVSSFGEHGSFQPLFLIQCLFFAFTTRGSNKSLGPNPYRALVLRAIDTLPPSAKTYLTDMLATVVYPSAAMITRARYFIDVAWMLLWAQRHHEFVSKGGVLFGMSDSSPQGRRDWMMSQYLAIKGEDLLEVGEAVCFHATCCALAAC